MNKKQNEIIQFLLEIICCKENQLINFLDCSKEDVKMLLNNKIIVKKDGIIYSKIRERVIDVRYCIATEILIKYKNSIKEYKKGKYPVLLSFIANNTRCDIIIAKKIEQETILKNLDEMSNGEKVIIVLEDVNEYDKELITSTKKCLICKYPLEIIDKIN